jgi:AraC family transcriptional regulator of adaptative response/methylated-DNA-[protein]-cysteine methyltransferase
MNIAMPRNHTADKTANDSRWRAVLNRDPAADGQFYYSVATTGV